MEHGVASSLRLQDAGPLAEAIERSAAAVEDAGFAS
jgi:hypothetical protein